MVKVQGGEHWDSLCEAGWAKGYHKHPLNLGHLISHALEKVNSKKH